jgi:hypothetical protein
LPHQTFVEDVVLLPDGRVFGIPSGPFRVVELKEWGSNEALTAANLAGQLPE